jgi:hypothetical protein
MIWNTLPTINNKAADVVLGQTSWSSKVSSPISSKSMQNPGGIYSDGTRLFVADTGNNRILIWACFPAENGAPADYVFGQNEFTSALSNAGFEKPSDETVHEPSGIFITPGSDPKLLVSDTKNNRVLIIPLPETWPEKNTQYACQL